MKTQDDIDAFNKRNKVQDNLDFIESHPLVSRVEVIGEGREFVKYDINGINIKSIFRRVTNEYSTCTII